MLSRRFCFHKALAAGENPGTLFESFQVPRNVQQVKKRVCFLLLLMLVLNGMLFRICETF